MTPLFRESPILRRTLPIRAHSPGPIEEEKKRAGPGGGVPGKAEVWPSPVKRKLPLPEVAFGYTKNRRAGRAYGH